MLEDQAEEEDEDEPELEALVTRANALFPENTVEQLVKELKQQGLTAFLKTHAIDEDGSERRDFSILHFLVALGILIPKSLRDTAHTPRSVHLGILKAALDRLLQRRSKLPQYNTVDDALQLLRTAPPESIIVLSGAGISTSCGIPDFRSKDGIYARLQESGQYDLDDPQDMFDKELFLYSPSLFYSFAAEIYPSNFTPSPSHKFIRLLETRRLLLRNYTQNIDTLESLAGITRVLACHGSFATASCVTCAFKCEGRKIERDIMERRVPTCPECEKRSSSQQQTQAHKKAKKHKNGRRSSSSYSDEEEHDDGKRTGILKPDITFFGEKLSSDFDRHLASDRSRASLLLVMGTSLQVAPVSSVVGHLPHDVPVVLINRTPVLHIGVDLMLLGEADLIVRWLERRLGWNPIEAGTAKAQEAKTAQGHSGSPGPGLGPTSSSPLTSMPSSDAAEEIDLDAIEPKRWKDSHIWLFPGADVTALESMEESQAEEEEEREEEEEGHEDVAAEQGKEDQEARKGDSEAAERRQQRDGDDDAEHAVIAVDGERGQSESREAKRARRQ
ncbi:SIR2-domain-containing protein [Jaminaea rosea]|uniref:SIR2-domain-containing protein n=1 Tax=Jaminaea rosea TaxID=1569628 RepID=A0A316US47_9BASI|nr:SIR2-domain-containing protein [Jaminaea rosea]PWN27598.1 SIR2-domain-containing protein [Jaminaea rosea]